jgi:hypothetical protein
MDQKFGDNRQNCKGVDMIRAEIGLKNRQIINETYSFRCFLIFIRPLPQLLFLVTIFHICTCDDVTLVNEKSIVSKRPISISVYYG